MEVRQYARVYTCVGENSGTLLWGQWDRTSPPQGPALCALRIHPPLQSNWRGECGHATYAGRREVTSTRERVQVTCSRKRVSRRWEAGRPGRRSGKKGPGAARRAHLRDARVVPKGAMALSRFGRGGAGEAAAIRAGRLRKGREKVPNIHVVRRGLLREMRHME